MRDEIIMASFTLAVGTGLMVFLFVVHQLAGADIRIWPLIASPLTMTALHCFVRFTMIKQGI